MTRSQLIALNRQGRVSNFVPPVIGVIVVAMLWVSVSPTLLLVWVGFVWCSSLIRIAMYRRFDRAVEAGRGHEAFWKRLWIGAYGLSGAIWGIGTMLMLPLESFLLEAFLALFVLGMAGGGTASFAPFSPALVTYLVPLVLPPTLMLRVHDSVPHVILGIGGCVFLLALVCLGRAGARSYRDSFLLGFQNEALSRELTAAQMRLAGALDSMSEAFALFDAKGRLVKCNNKFDEILREIIEDLASGISLTEFFGLLGRSGRVRAASGRAGEWTADDKAEDRSLDQADPEGPHRHRPAELAGKLEKGHKQGDGCHDGTAQQSHDICEKGQEGKNDHKRPEPMQHQGFHPIETDGLHGIHFLANLYGADLSGKRAARTGRLQDCGVRFVVNLFRPARR